MSQLLFDFAPAPVHRRAMNPRHFSLFGFLLVLALLSRCANGSEPRTAGFCGLLLVANKGARTLAIVEPTSGRLLGAVPEDGVTGHEVAASPDGKFAFVPLYGDSGVGRPGSDGRLMRVIDLAAQKIVGTVDFGKGVRPHCAVFGPKNGLLYVTTELDDSVTVVDPHTWKILNTIPTGQHESHMLALSRDGRRGYTANVGPGTVSVLDLENGKTLAVVPISRETQRISISVDDHWVFTADQTQPRLAVLDTKTNGLKCWVPLPGIGYGTAPTPDGRWLLVALPGARKLGVVDLGTLKCVRELDLPPSPQEVLVQPDGVAAYVSCDSRGQVGMVNLKNWTVEKLISTGRGADGLAWAKAD